MLSFTDVLLVYEVYMKILKAEVKYMYVHLLPTVSFFF